MSSGVYKNKIVRKAVIPAAGLGTRFLPVTKAIPKELLPIGTKPTLQIVIEELIASGISEVIMITSPHKQGLKEYFERSTFYDHALKATDKEHLLHGLRRVTDNIELQWVIQENPKGLGHAVLCAKEAVQNEPFIICLPDVLIESKTPCSLQLINVFEKLGEAVNAVEHVKPEQIGLYGIYDVASSSAGLHKARGIVEKPKVSDAPSDIAVVGRYLFTSEIFKILENTKPGHGGEIQLADAMNQLAKMGKMYAYEYEGRQFDTGDKLGFLMANIYYGYKEFPKEIGSFIKTL